MGVEEATGAVLAVDKRGQYLRSMDGGEVWYSISQLVKDEVYYS